MEFRVIEYAHGFFYLETNSPVKKWGWGVKYFGWRWVDNWQRVKDCAQYYGGRTLPDKVFKSDDEIMAEVDKIKNYPRTVKQFII